MGKLAGAPRSSTPRADVRALHRHDRAAANSKQPATITKLFANADAISGRPLYLCGIDVYDTTIVAAARWIIQRAISGLPAKVGFVNAHCVNVVAEDDRYGEALRDFDRLFIDGSGMRLAARLGGLSLTDNVNGTDLFPVLCGEAAEKGASLFLLGGRPGIADGAAQSMITHFPHLAIAGTADGYFKTGEAEDAVIQRINDSGAAVLLVGLGVPNQEIWIARNRRRLKATVILGVGGLFDYYSGRIPRAPALIRAAGMEWAWRLAMEPSRLANRYLVGNLVFLARIAWWRVASPETFASGVPAVR